MTPEQIVEHVNTLIEHSPRVRLLWEAWEAAREPASGEWASGRERFAGWFMRAVQNQPDHATKTSAKLSPREEQVAELLALGHTCGEIAEKLGVSTKTIDTHRAHILKKLGVRNVVELARRTMATE